MFTLTDNHKVSQFYDWWVKGILLPLPKSRPKRLVLDLSGAKIEFRVRPADPPKLLSERERLQLLKSRDNNGYLAVPSHAVISTSIPVLKRGLSPAEVVSSLLPFSANEVLGSIDRKSNKLHAVVRADIKQRIASLRENNISVAGVAFSGEVDFIFVDFEAPLNSSSSRLPVSWYALLALPLVAFVLAVSYWWHAESTLQSRLKDVLNDSQSESLLTADDGFPSLLSIASSASVSQNHLLLQSLVNSLSDGAVVDQIIVNESELLMDMQAPSGSLVKTEIDATGLFLSSQFVSAITTDLSQNSERFRLKLILLNQTGARGFDDR
ncbi:MAG: hypothetical protein ACI9LY_003468 [Arenicella sp.]|jgi:hypothetical protein